MPTNSDSFKPQPHDPRWKSALANPPRKEDYPIWIDARDYAGTTDGHHIRLWEYDDIDHTDPWSCRTRWLSDKEARSPIPCDRFAPVFPAYVFCPGYRHWGWIGSRDTTDRVENSWVSRVTHWFPLEKGKRAALGDEQPRLPRFPEGNPPAGYRWLGEGETVKKGDHYFVSEGRHVAVSGLVGSSVGDFDCDHDMPYIRPLDKPTAAPTVDPETEKSLRGSSDDLPPPAGLSALEDSLDELHDKIDSVSDGLGGDFTNAFERLAAVERKLDRLLSHLGAHKPEV